MMTIVPASPAHIRRIANRMRAVDQLECRAHGREPVEALRYSLRSSLEAWTALEDGRPVAMFGVCPLSMIGRSASPWLLGTEDVGRHGRLLLTHGRRTIERWRDHFDEMSNEVAASNTLAIRLLRHWGATFGEEVAYGGTAFRRFKLGG